jgi:hypothetical protein
MKLFSYGKHPSGSTGLCLFETDFATFTKDLCEWWSELGWKYDCFNVNGVSWLDFFERYDNLYPRYIITPTRTNWVIFFDNNIIGDIYWSVFRNMAERLKIRSVGILIDNNEIARLQNRPFGMKFWYADSRDRQTIDRCVTLIRDGNKWEFDQYGDPLPFEKAEVYLNRKKADRLSIALISEYLACLGIDSESDDFLIPEQSLGIKRYIQPQTDEQVNAVMQKMVQIANESFADTGQKVTVRRLH